MVFFVTDLHGKIERYEKLFRQIEIEKPELVFIGGDLLPHISPAYNGVLYKDFIPDYLGKRLQELRASLQEDYPKIFLIFGNDDPRSEEQKILKLEAETKLFHYAHNRKFEFETYSIYGYSYIPPTPFY